MSQMKAPTTFELIWEHDLVLKGRSADAEIVLDSAGKAGPSPVQALAFALAGCMAMDVVYILQKGRLDLKGLKVALSAERAQEDPHRITAVTIDFTVTGDIAKDADSARRRPLAREVLLGLALHAPGHRFHDHHLDRDRRLARSASIAR